MICGLVLCDPCNPTGGVYRAEEMDELALELSMYNWPVFVDESYAELCFVERTTNWITVFKKHRILPRLLVLRSGTKALSMCGERLACIILYDPAARSELVSLLMGSLLHPPMSGQRSFAYAMRSIVHDKIHLNQIRSYYGAQVRIMQRLLKGEIPLEGPSSSCSSYPAATPVNLCPSLPGYNVHGSFYVLADCSLMRGQAVTDMEQWKEIKRVGLVAANKENRIETDWDCALSLLFQDGVALLPLSACGRQYKDRCLLRITCSGGDTQIRKIVHILRRRCQTVHTI